MDKQKEAEVFAEDTATLIGFASGSRCVHAKVGEKPTPPKDEPPDDFFDPPT